MTPPVIVFVCIGNSCRSPMAEAIARGIADGRAEVLSAGIAPTGWIADETRSTLEAMGYSTDGLYSKGLDDISWEGVDVAVSLIGASGLGVLPHNVGEVRRAWSIRDPFGDDNEVYRAVARDLESRIRDLLGELSESGIA